MQQNKRTDREQDRQTSNCGREQKRIVSTFPGCVYPAKVLGLHAIKGPVNSAYPATRTRMSMNAKMFSHTKHCPHGDCTVSRDRFKLVGGSTRFADAILLQYAAGQPLEISLLLHKQASAATEQQPAG